jgi:hypothetical protein
VRAVASPSTRPWLGVGAALGALTAAVGCFCAALLLAAVADSDPGVVYEQHRWLGAIVAAGAVCAFVAMMGWATLRHGGVPAPVLLIALAVAGLPFALPGGWLLPGAAVAVALCAALAAAGLARPPASQYGVRALTAGLALTALVLAVGQAVVVGLHHPAPRAAVKASRARLHTVSGVPTRHHPSHRSAPVRAAAGRAPAPRAASRRAAPAPIEAAPAATPNATAPAALAPHPTVAPAPAPAPTPATPAPAAAERFVRDYYAAIDARRYGVAWRMLAPAVQARFGGFATWRRGYARTVASTPGSLRVTAAPGGATVALTLRAGDRDACGKTVERRFAVTWRLARTDAGWRATAAAARALTASGPAAGC